MNISHYIGFDVHKKTVNYCVKTADGQIVEEGKLPALRVKLTWALEIADPHRFSANGDAMSYCGLTSALRSSAGKQQRSPISKQRNAWLQTALIEAAKLAPRWNPQLATVHACALERGHRNRATLQVARKLVAYFGRGQKWPALSGAHANASPGRCADRGLSFLRHADLSPDGHRGTSTETGISEKIPVVTHRSDESGRIFLAGCSSAEPASASPVPSDYQKFYVRVGSDLPAGPSLFGDCARKLLLPMRLAVCFKAAGSP